jgi:hypothetical protein
VGGASPLHARASESRDLGEWAKAANRVRDRGEFRRFPVVAEDSGENEVRWRPSDGRIVKLTHPGGYGFSLFLTEDGKWNSRIGTPVEYLERIRLFNEAFGGDWKMEGVILPSEPEQNGLVQILTSQSRIEAADSKYPYPNMAEIEGFMRGLGFERVAGFLAWRNAERGIVVGDVRGPNFIKSKRGIVPIDLLVTEEKAMGSSLSASEAPGADDRAEIERLMEALGEGIPEAVGEAHQEASSVTERPRHRGGLMP